MESESQAALGPTPGTKRVRNALSDSEDSHFQFGRNRSARERAQPVRPTVAYRVGMRAPRTAQLYAVPETLAVTALKTDKDMMVNNRVVLVDPATGEVVDEFAE